MILPDDNVTAIPHMTHGIPEDGLHLEVGVNEASRGADHAGREWAANADLAYELVHVGREPERDGPVRVQFSAHVVDIELEGRIRYARTMNVPLYSGMYSG